MMTRWKTVSAMVAVAVGAGILALASMRVDPLRAKERRNWKDGAITRIGKRVADTNWIAAEIRAIRARIAQDGIEGGWFSQELILLKNGEWLVFGNKCNKEDPKIRDIFVARGSDGQWRFSTFHFCIGMISLHVEDQPESLAAFNKTFFTRPFDGRSDECLNKTWPPPRRMH